MEALGANTAALYERRLGAVVAAGAAIWEKMNDTSSQNAILGGRFIVGMVVIYVVLIILGFVTKRGKQSPEIST